MATKTKSKAAAAEAAVDWRQAAEDLPEQADIYPRLPFGDTKEAEGSYVVEFLDAEPRSIRFQDKTLPATKKDARGRGVEWPEVEGWALSLMVHQAKGFEGSEDRNIAKAGQRRSVILRKPEPRRLEDGTMEVDGETGKPKMKHHSLTRGILKLVQRHGSLLNRRAEVTARNYEGAYGLTRAYDVFDLSPDDETKVP